MITAMCDCTYTLKKTAILLFVAGAMALVSCDPSGSNTGNGGGEELPPEDSGVTVVIEAGEGSEAVAAYEFASDWEVLSADGGYEVSPSSGKAGAAELTVSATNANPGLGEREAEFSISDGGQETIFHVVQRGTPQLVLSATQYEMAQASGKIEIVLDGNVPFEAETAADWLEITDTAQSDSVLLSDGRTYSDSLRSVITVQASANESSEAREATVTLTAGTQEYEVKVSQAAAVTADWSKEFFRRSSILRFTATWCYNCPRMYEAIKIAMEELPDRIIPLNLHGMSSEGGLAYYRSGEFEDLYGVEGYPTGIANNAIQVANDRQIENIVPGIVGVVQEAIESYPARTGISAQSQISDNTIKVDISVAVKEADDYKVCVYLIENGIVHEQKTDDGPVLDYVHDYVIRSVLTEDLFGDPLPSCGDNEMVTYSVEAALPRSVLDQANLSVVIAVARPDNLEVRGVENATYLEEIGIIYDNVTLLPANGFVNFEYEQ